MITPDSDTIFVRKENGKLMLYIERNGKPLGEGREIAIREDSALEITIDGQFMYAKFGATNE